jgi:hypothetical protein
MLRVTLMWTIYIIRKVESRREGLAGFVAHMGHEKSIALDIV